jgi:hypothetical protein
MLLLTIIRQNLNGHAAWQALIPQPRLSELRLFL